MSTQVQVQQSPGYRLDVPQMWRGLSRKRKIIWVIAILWCVLHVVGLGGDMLFDPDYNRQAAAVGSDLVTYLNAADAIQAHQSLYLLTPWPSVMTYHYHPLYALAFSLISGIDFRVLSVLGIFLQIAGYAGALYVWYRVLQALNLTRAAHVYVTWLPLALMFTPWLANFMYWNIVPLLLLLAGILTLAIVEDRPVLAAVIALSIVVIKPQWLFPLMLLVIFRRWKRLIQIGLGLLGLYGIANGLYLLLVGPAYGMQTLQDYATFLMRLNQNYPWEGQGPTFIHMNHSWNQIFLHYAGFQPWVPLATAAAILGMAALVGWQIIRAWQRQVTMRQYPELVMLFVWLGFLVSTASLGQIWEVGGGLFLFFFLQASDNRRVRWFSLIFLLYALSEIPEGLGMLTGQTWLVFGAWLPETMIYLLILYFSALILVHERLNQPQAQTEAI